MAPRVSSGEPLCRPIVERQLDDEMRRRRRRRRRRHSPCGSTAGSVGRPSSKTPGGAVGSRCGGEVFDVGEDQIGRVLGKVGILGKDHRHRLADIAHLGGREHRLAVGPEAGHADLAEVDRRDVGDVGRVHTRDHAGQRQRLRRVDAEDAAMGHRRAHDAHVELAGKADVGGEAALSGEERPVLEPPDRAADDAPSPHLFGRGANRLEDVLVAGAAAEVGGEHLALRVLVHRPGSAPARRPPASGSPACRSRIAARDARRTPPASGEGRRPSPGPRRCGSRALRPAPRTSGRSAPGRRRPARCRRRRRRARSRDGCRSGRNPREARRRASAAARPRRVRHAVDGERERRAGVMPPPSFPRPGSPPGCAAASPASRRARRRTAGAHRRSR